MDRLSLKLRRCGNDVIGQIGRECPNVRELLIHCSEELGYAWGLEVAKLRTLKALEIKAFSVDRGLLRGVTKLPLLSRLKISADAANDDWRQSVQAKPAELEDDSGRELLQSSLPPSIWEELASCTKLEHLALDTELNPTTLEWIAGLVGLRKLDLSECDFTDSLDSDHVDFLEKLPRLEEVRLDIAPNRTLEERIPKARVIYGKPSSEQSIITARRGVPARRSGVVRTASIPERHRGRSLQP
jgi:hypothetical protein